MQIHVEPDLAIPLPYENLTLDDFKEKAEAACKSAEFLGLDMTATPEDKEEAQQALYDMAENEPKATKKLARKEHKPAMYGEVKTLLDDFSFKVVENAVQIRLLVTNKLLLETSNQDPRIRMRALELLGKITDVGLFTEKSEVTVNHRSTEELVNSIRSKIQKLMRPDAEEVAYTEVNGDKFDLDKELGLDVTPAEQHHVPEGTQFDDDNEQSS